MNIKTKTAELGELTEVFKVWGSSFSDELDVTEDLSSYELGKLTRNNRESGDVAPLTGKKSIYDEFSLSRETSKILEKYENE